MSRMLRDEFAGSTIGDLEAEASSVDGGTFLGARGKVGLALFLACASGLFATALVHAGLL